jgi:hypothetical protein
MNKRLILMALGCFLGLFLTSCGDPIVGTWMESTTEFADSTGFTLQKDGSVVPINMGYYEYKTWKKDGDKLILSGQFTGTNPHDFCDSMNIQKLTKEELVLEQGGYSLNFQKK